MVDLPNADKLDRSQTQVPTKYCFARTRRSNHTVQREKHCKEGCGASLATRSTLTGFSSRHHTPFNWQAFVTSTPTPTRVPLSHTKNLGHPPLRRHRDARYGNRLPMPKEDVLHAPPSCFVVLSATIWDEILSTSKGYLIPYHMTGGPLIV